MNKETVKKLLSFGSAEDQKLGLEYLQYLEDQEIEEIIPLYGTKSHGYSNQTHIHGGILLEKSLLLLGTVTIVRYPLADFKHWVNEISMYQQLNKNLTPWQENQLIQQNQDK